MIGQLDLERDRQLLRRLYLMRRVLNGLRDTIQLQGMTPETPTNDVRIVMTDKSVEFIAPLIEAVDILETIIFASDGCRGHKMCAHSMEPWQRARRLLEGKWREETEGVS